MNRNKIEYASIYMGVDTIQIKSKTAIEFDSDLYPFIHADIVRKSDGSYSYYILNPDKAYQTSIYNSTDYNNSLNYMLDSIALDEPIKSRVDFENLLTLLNEKDLTSISSCKESAKKYKKRYGLEFFSLNDLNAYKVKLIESGADFFEM